MRVRALVRAVRLVGVAQSARAVRAALRTRRADGAARRGRAPERARVPGRLLDVRPGPGGGLLRFSRTTLEIRVTVGGAVFFGWDGAAPEPSYALDGDCPEPDVRTELEPDKDGGWQIVSERMTVAVSRHGAVEIRTPGGRLLRHEQPPRWWETAAGDVRWVSHARVAADARFFGLGGRAGGPRLRGAFRLWNTDPGGSFGPGDDPLSVTMPVQFVVADAGCHLLFVDNSWDGLCEIGEGAEGHGSGHDRPGRSRLRMSGGPLRYWALVGTPARLLQGWAALTGSPAVPPGWALGHQHARWGFGSGAEVRRVVAGYRERGLPLSAVHLDIDHYRDHRVFTVDTDRFPRLPHLARELREEGVRLVSIVDPGVAAAPGDPVYDGGQAIDAFVRAPDGHAVRGVAWPGYTVFPDFTDPRVRKWWGGLYAERLEQGFEGFWHDMNEPTALPPVGGWSAAFGDRSLPLNTRHVMDGRSGDHREAHNVYGLTMARAGYEGLRELCPDRRPFLFSRSGWAGMQRYGGTWSGDVATGWPGLRASLSLTLGLGLCGVPYSGPDIGGFDGRPSPELYLRWFQLGSYLPLFRTHCARHAGRREPWEFGAEVLEHARACLEERQRLLPYFATLAVLAERTGAPYARPLWWHEPRRRALRDCEDAFLLGDDLLVAPVLDEGARSRSVPLPKGRWYDTRDGRAYDGPGRVTLAAPLGEVPVLARAGCVLPVTGRDGGLELEVWPPAPGRSGGGTVAVGPPDGWEPATVEQYTVRWAGRVSVERADGARPRYPVRVRGV
ncbi:glycoside hydrolase family 31 protein [Streptomyces sp. NPDC051940]|uniref:glycoside hydrolase family 31 protein n=1 Tax=Streptomyces sp. NPDC051940 TaxID=3155675 RepID=UPI003446C95C